MKQSIRYADNPEAWYVETVPTEHRKALRQFFTPRPIARFMARWVLGNPECHTLLDPALGLGIFLRAAAEQAQGRDIEMLGYDVDTVVLEHARELFGGGDKPTATLLQQDYLLNHWDKRYDGIICNPPYLRFQDAKSREQSLAEFEEKLGLGLSGLSNIYALFMLKSVHQLSQGGRAAYIVPSEFFNSDYGVQVKKALADSGCLRYVLLFKGEEEVFQDVITTSCILLFAKDEAAEEITFIEVERVADLPALAEQLDGYPDAGAAGITRGVAELNPATKWRQYYHGVQAPAYHNLVPFSTLGRVKRGIATGDNDFFTFDRKKQRQYGIPDQYLLPCITKAADARREFFDMVQFEALAERGRRVFLLNAVNSKHDAVQTYIREGEERGSDQRFLTRHRSPWYALEQRPPAPIWVTVFNRGAIRLVRNEANILNLTCFHSMYLNLFAADQEDLLMAYFLTDISKEVIAEQRREYGRGLRKFELNDLNNARVIDLGAIGPDLAEDILEVYAQYRRASLHGGDTEPFRQTLNQFFEELILA